MLSPDWGTARLFLHVIAAALWVGGQLALAGLVPTLRGAAPGAPAAAARAFARIAWPAFVLLVGTGAWNIVAEHAGQKSPAWRVTLWVKLGIVALSGLSAWVHTRARGPRQLAVWGGLAGTSAIAALFLGVLLAG